jgi:ATP-dependent Clp protease ATP-binding subunit ClpC
METAMISVARFTTSAQETAQRTAGIMQRYGHHQVDTEHLLLALLELPQGGISQLLEFLRVDASALSQKLDALLRTTPAGELVEVGPGQISITPRVARILELADKEARQMNDEQISTEHIFLEIFNEHDTPAAGLLEQAGLTRDRVYEAIRQMRG